MYKDKQKVVNKEFNLKIDLGNIYSPFLDSFILSKLNISFEYISYNDMHII